MEILDNIRELKEHITASVDLGQKIFGKDISDAELKVINDDIQNVVKDLSDISFGTEKISTAAGMLANELTTSDDIDDSGNDPEIVKVVSE